MDLTWVIFWLINQKLGLNELLYTKSLSDKYYIYLYTYVIICQYLLSITLQWYCLWGYRLSTKRVVAHPFHLVPFSPMCARIGTIGWQLPCNLLYDFLKLYVTL